ncbi:MAG: NifU family protein [Bacteroidales bacterium]
MVNKAKEDIMQRVNTTLDQVRPYLQADGGDIEVIELTGDNVLKVRLTGACKGCPFSMQTLKAGVEQAIKRDVPEISEVVSEDS